MIRRDIYSVKADERDGAGFCHVLMTYNLRQAISRRNEIRNDHSLGFIRLAKIVHPAQWVVDAFTAVGNTITGAKP
jgi:hypothetical protein